MLDVEQFDQLWKYLGIIGTIVFVAKTFIPVDFGAEVHGDFTTLTDTDTSFNLFSIESISAFFMCSGWIGLICHKYSHYSLKLSCLISLLAGIFGMLFFAWLIFQFKKLEHIPKTDLNELVNKQGKAYMNFQPKGTSKIQIEINSRLDILDAINLDDVEINSFEEIKVVKVEEGKIYIKKISN